jgi:hypothetical protein
MKYSVYFLLVVFCLVHSYSFGMIFSGMLPFLSNPASPSSRYVHQPNPCVDISSEKIKENAQQFLDHVDAFKAHAEKVLDMENTHLSERQRTYLLNYMARCTSMRASVSEEPKCVYEKICQFTASSRDDNFWKELVKKRHIDQPIFSTHEKQRSALDQLFEQLKKERLIIGVLKSNKSAL